MAGWRQVSVRATKTKADWAVEMAALLEGRYAECQKVIVAILVKRFRQVWPGVKIVVRGDSGFCRWRMLR